VTEKCTKNDGYLSVTDVPLCYSLFPKNYIRFSGSMVLVGHPLNIYFAPFLRLHSRQSIWQFSTMVRPPSRHGMIWSPSMNSMSNSLPHIGQT
jgi:hypothetical protein